MSKSKVFFTDLNTKPGNNLTDKLKHLIVSAGAGDLEYKDKFTAVKIHFGEWGNLAYIRPNYARVVIDFIAEKGGRPFLTDANTLYVGKRANAVDHLWTAHANGFNYLATNCNVIIADGLKGTEYREIEINQKHCKTAKIASAIADSDIIISLNHFKGHEMTGFGGALKNLGMGSGSRGGKLEMHSASKPKIEKEKCVSCGVCVKNCSQKAISFDSAKKASIDYDLCIGCGQCVAVCMFDSAQVVWNEGAETCTEKISEYTLAVLKDKQHFHINFVMNVSPNCDCWGHNDVAIVRDIGIAASKDPVALDAACADMVNSSTMATGSVLEKTGYSEGKDKFNHIYPNTNWKSGINHAVEIGIGNKEYELIKV